MKIRAQYYLAFLSSLIVIFAVAGSALWGVSNLKSTTDYLVHVNSYVLENSSLFEKELAKSRRAEKEFFIFPDNEAKQEKYVKSWRSSYKNIYGYISELRKLFTETGNTDMLAKLDEAENAMTSNEKEFAIVVNKFKKTKSYDAVNKAEYGSFKKKTHIIEDISANMTEFGLGEVAKGRAKLADTQSKVSFLIQGITGLAIVWGLLVPALLSRRLTSFILKLTDVSTKISQGNLTAKVPTGRKDELGDLASSLVLMQKSLLITVKKFKDKDLARRENRNERVGQTA